MEKLGWSFEFVNTYFETLNSKYRSKGCAEEKIGEGVIRCETTPDGSGKPTAQRGFVIFEIKAMIFKQISIYKVYYDLRLNVF